LLVLTRRAGRRVAAVTAALVSLLACSPAAVEIDRSGPVADWPAYGGTTAGLSWSPLTQIDRANVEHLELAWSHHSGQISDGTGEWSRTSMQTRPILPNDTLYYCTGFDNVIALDPESGEERWRFDPELRLRQLGGPYPLVCRGVSYWSAGEGAGGEGVCQERIFIGTKDSELVALDAVTGEPCRDFGNGGRVALREGMADAPAWEYYITSPPLVLGDVVVLGALVQDNLRVDAPAGVVRAFDARSGELLWAWDPVPPGFAERERATGEPVYTSGTPNVWSIISGDPERGLVFVPTGNPSPDLFNAVRQGLDYYGSSVVALHAESGEVAWHFQTVHSDVWDYDVPAEPVLFEIPGVGGGRPGVAQITKMGFLFLLDRETGEPLYTVEERPVPVGDVAGEKLSPTQPFPTHPGPLAPLQLTPDEAYGFPPIDRGDCREKLSQIRNEGIFTPPSERGSIVYPGNAGGPNWGGMSLDPESGVAFVNMMRAPTVATLIPREAADQLDFAAAAYPEELYPMKGAPFGVRRAPILSNFGAPCVPPPWGTLSAVDLKSGEVKWEVTLGTTRDQAPWPLWFENGAPNLGGTLATAGGLVFIGATTDKFFRAFDAENGELLWQRRIPYTANATPMTYRLPDGRQFVVVAAGGHGWSEPGDALLAFALPAKD
jgi:quinoprotein glucose dehydrogenase